jgi:hypothetical protein
MVGTQAPQGGAAQPKPGMQGLNEKVQQRYQQSQVPCARLSRPLRITAPAPSPLRAFFSRRTQFVRRTKRLVCTKHLSCRPGCAHSGAAALAIACGRAIEWLCRMLGGLLPPTPAVIRVPAALPVRLKGVRMRAQLQQRNTATQQNQAAVATNESGVLAKRKIKEIVDQVSAFALFHFKFGTNVQYVM